MNLWVLLDVRDSANPETVIEKDARTQSEDMGKSNVGPCFKALKLLKCFKIRSFINQLWIFQFTPVVDSAEYIPPRRIRNFVSAKFSASSLDYHYRNE